MKFLGSIVSFAAYQKFIPLYPFILIQFFVILAQKIIRLPPDILYIIGSFAANPIKDKKGINKSEDYMMGSKAGYKIIQDFYMDIYKDY
jgi:hypothetical protein